MRQFAGPLACATLAATLVLGGCAGMGGEPVQTSAPAAGGASGQQAWDDAQSAYMNWVASSHPGWKVSENGVIGHKLSGKGEGDHPTPTDTVTINYEGKLITGSIFDSSYQRGQPATFPLPQLIKGWRDGVPMMRKGETWEFIIPADMAYGARARSGIPANSTLIFKIELIDFHA